MQMNTEEELELSINMKYSKLSVMCKCNIRVNELNFEIGLFYVYMWPTPTKPAINRQNTFWETDKWTCHINRKRRNFQVKYWLFMGETLSEFDKWYIILELRISAFSSSINMMRSREISLKSNLWHFQFSIWLKCSFEEVIFAENLAWIGPVVPKL